MESINATEVREDKGGIRMTWRSGNLNKKAQEKKVKGGFCAAINTTQNDLLNHLVSR